MRLLLILAAVSGLPTTASAQWRQSTQTDEITGERSVFAISPRVGATRAMSFPYSDTRAWIGFGCTETSEWAYLGFSEAPNLTDSETGDGFNRVSARSRWDDEVRTERLRQDWGDRFLTFSDSRPVIERIRSAGTFLIELNWYGNGPTYFRFPLRGSTAGIDQARRACGRDGPPAPFGNPPGRRVSTATVTTAIWVGDSERKVYVPKERRDCWYADGAIPPTNREWFLTEQDAIDAGYARSTTCR